MDLSKRIEKYWDKRSDEFCNLRLSELNSDKRKLWEHEIRLNIPDIEKSKLNILDIGTGSGFFAIILKSLGHDVIGIDLSKNMVNSAKNVSELLGYDIKFSVMNAQELKFEDNCFDVIVSRNLTWTLPAVEKAYEEWYRVLKKGGQLINFDADYGKVSFCDEAKYLDSNHAHNKVESDTLKECDEIKKKLYISKENRPIWDMKILQRIGFRNFKIDKSISNRIYSEKDEFCNPTDMFSIYAVK